jgi:hypothetical protein
LGSFGDENNENKMLATPSPPKCLNSKNCATPLQDSTKKKLNTNLQQLTPKYEQKNQTPATTGDNNDENTPEIPTNYNKNPLEDVKVVKEEGGGGELESTSKTLTTTIEDTRLDDIMTSAIQMMENCSIKSTATIKSVVKTTTTTSTKATSTPSTKKVDTSAKTTTKNSKTTNSASASTYSAVNSSGYGQKMKSTPKLAPNSSNNIQSTIKKTFAKMKAAFNKTPHHHQSDNNNLIPKKCQNNKPISNGTKPNGTNVELFKTTDSMMVNSIDNEPMSEQDHRRCSSVPRTLKEKQAINSRNAEATAVDKQSIKPKINTTSTGKVNSHQQYLTKLAAPKKLLPNQHPIDINRRRSKSCNKSVMNTTSSNTTINRISRKPNTTSVNSSINNSTSQRNTSRGSNSGSNRPGFGNSAPRFGSNDRINKSATINHKSNPSPLVKVPTVNRQHSVNNSKTKLNLKNDKTIKFSYFF